MAWKFAIWRFELQRDVQDFLSRISVKLETFGAGEVYLSDGREKSGFHHIDFDLCPNQILEKSLWNSFIIYKGIIYIFKRNFNINRISG